MTDLAAQGVQAMQHQDHRNEIGHVVEQGQRKGCPIAAYAMRLLDLGLELTQQDIQDIRLFNGLEDARMVAARLNERGVETQIEYINDDQVVEGEPGSAPRANAVDYLREQIPLRGPVILSIMHERLGGHWIIVEEVIEEAGQVYFVIRNSYSDHQRGYEAGFEKITEAALRQLIHGEEQEGDPQSMIWSWLRSRAY